MRQPTEVAAGVLGSFEVHFTLGHLCAGHGFVGDCQASCCQKHLVSPAPSAEVSPSRIGSGRCSTIFTLFVHRNLGLSFPCLVVAQAGGHDARVHRQRAGGALSRGAAGDGAGRPKTWIFGRTRIERDGLSAPVDGCPPHGPKYPGVDRVNVIAAKKMNFLGRGPQSARAWHPSAEPLEPSQFGKSTARCAPRAPGRTEVKHTTSPPRARVLPILSPPQPSRPLPPLGREIGTVAAETCFQCMLMITNASSPGS